MANATQQITNGASLVTIGDQDFTFIKGVTWNINGNVVTAGDDDSLAQSVAFFTGGNIRISLDINAVGIDFISLFNQKITSLDIRTPVIHSNNYIKYSFDLTKDPNVYAIIGPAEDTMAHGELASEKFEIRIYSPAGVNPIKKELVSGT